MLMRIEASTGPIALGHLEFIIYISRTCSLVSSRITANGPGAGHSRTHADGGVFFFSLWFFFFFFSFTDLPKDFSPSTSSTASLRMEPFYAQAKSQTHCFRRCESFAGLSNAIATYECRFFCLYIYMPWYNFAAHTVPNGRVREKFRTKSKSEPKKKKKKNWQNDQGGARPTGGHSLKWTCCRIKSPKWTDETVNYNYIDIYLFFYIFVLVSFHKMQMILLSVIFFILFFFCLLRKHLLARKELAGHLVQEGH